LVGHHSLSNTSQQLSSVPKRVHIGANADSREITQASQDLPFEALRFATEYFAQRADQDSMPAWIVDILSKLKKHLGISFQRPKNEASWTFILV
jgi:hypothetical protein